jgi:hypothetical protein
VPERQELSVFQAHHSIQFDTGDAASVPSFWPAGVQELGRVDWFQTTCMAWSADLNKGRDSKCLQLTACVVYVCIALYCSCTFASSDAPWHRLVPEDGFVLLGRGRGEAAVGI